MSETTALSNQIQTGAVEPNSKLPLNKNRQLFLLLHLLTPISATILATELLNYQISFINQVLNYQI